MFQVPPSTRYDLTFRVLGIHVRVHPLFWLIALLFGSSRSQPLDILVWVVVVFISILIHEVGHVLAMRQFNGDGQIVLHSFGGLAIPTKGGNRTPQQQIVISLAGPAAGFLLAAIVILIVQLTGGVVQYNTILGIIPFPQAGYFGVHYLVNSFISSLLWVNIFWGLINLVPVYPLDGGQTALSIFSIRDPWGGPRKALQLSVVTGVVMAVASLVLLSGLYMAFLFGLLAYQSYQRLNSLGRY